MQFYALIILLLAHLPAWSQTAAWHAGIAKVIPKSDLNRRPGTAFVVALRGGSAYLVTSAHVVEGDPSPQIEFVVDTDRTFRATVRHLEAGEERGLALLVVSSPPAGVQALVDAGQSLPALGTRVDVAGFPAPFGTFTVVDTSIATRRGRDMILSRETGEGFSGGPVMRDGAVTGLIFGREGGFGKAVGSASLREYLAGHGFTWVNKQAQDIPLAPPATKPSSPRAGAVRTNPVDGQPYVWIPPGEFQMGCSEGDSECNTNEKPQHKVRITRGFWLGQTEVTQAAYEKVLRENPSHFKGRTAASCRQHNLGPSAQVLRSSRGAVAHRGGVGIRGASRERRTIWRSERDCLA
jgi:hypothetical protein